MGDYFYQLSLASILLYFFGVVFFFFGGLVISLSTPRLIKVPFIRFKRTQRELSLSYLKLFVVVSALMVPVYWSYIAGHAGTSSLVGIRYFLVNNPPPQGLSFYANIPIFASLCFIGCLLELENKNFSKSFTVLIGVSSIVMLSMSGSKMGFVTILMMWMICSATVSNRVNLRLFLIVFLLIIIGFIGGVWLINLRGAESSLDLLAMFKIIASYLLGGIIAFDQVLSNADLYSSNQTMIRFFVETYAKLGGAVDVPSIHAQYTNINASENTNTYTHFYTYFLDIGVFGSLFTIFALGIFTTYLWLHVSYERPIIFFMHTGLILALIFTIYSEKILLGMNQAIKTIIFAFFLYHIVPFLHMGIRDLLFSRNHKF
tara:strand:- start:43 stop:1161 length:1119 start_codon:yes stop_codon:yes gene_type:complete